MKSKIILLLSSGALFAASVLGQTFSLDWHKVAGGGGSSTNGQFGLSGTIGQHDAGLTMSGGNYSLNGGFWQVFTVPTSGLPSLNIRLSSANTVVVSWPSSATGFTLQQNGNLNTPNWVTPSESITDDGTNKFIVVSPATSARFYRLLGH
jgi:hypothetical protein